MNKKSVIIKLFKYIKKYNIYLIFSLILSLVTVAATLYIPILTGQAVDKIISKGNVDFDNVFLICKNIFIYAIITMASQWLMNILNNKITYGVIRDFRKDAFAKIEKLPISFVDQNPYGQIESRIIADVDQLADGLLMGFTQLFTGIITILGTLIFMINVNLPITLVVVLVTPLSLLAAAFIAKKTYEMFKYQSEIRGKQTSLIEEMIGNQKVLKAFVYEDKAIEEFDEINEDLYKYSLKATFLSSITNPSTRFVNNIVYASVGIIGAIYALNGGISVGQLTCFLTYANQYTKPFNEISGVIAELQNALACADRIFKFLEEDEEIENHEDSLELANGKVEIENISFSYDKNKPLIENFNLSIEKGQRIAIVGPTGCGKTTFINLLMRFYDIDKGKIKISGKDIMTIDRKDLRNQYGMVLQETWVRRGSIRDNITLGNRNFTDEQIIKATKAVHAHSFIKRMPQGYDTLIGENGDNLSEGQKQLLCISRVMLNLPPMLILDEATSSIDTRTELRIQRAFHKMMNGRTSFIVAHRLSTIKEADVILVMKDGHIIEKGNHESLLKQNGFYKKLYLSQWG